MKFIETNRRSPTSPRSWMRTTFLCVILLARRISRLKALDHLGVRGQTTVDDLQGNGAIENPVVVPCTPRRSLPFPSKRQDLVTFAESVARTEI